MSEHEARVAAGAYCAKGHPSDILYCGLCGLAWSPCCGEPRPCPKEDNDGN